MRLSRRFFIPLVAVVAVVVVVVLDVVIVVDLSFFFVFSAFLPSSDEVCLEGGVSFSFLVVAAAATAVLPFVSLFSVFFRFLLPGAFFNAWVRLFSLSVLMRRLRRAISVGRVGRIGIISFSAYGSLHYSLILAVFCSNRRFAG